MKHKHSFLSDLSNCVLFECICLFGGQKPSDTLFTALTNSKCPPLSRLLLIPFTCFPNLLFNPKQLISCTELPPNLTLPNIIKLTLLFNKLH